MKPVICAEISNTPEQVNEQALDAYISENYKTMHDLVETYVEYFTETGQREPLEQLFDPLCSSLEDLMEELGISQKVRAVMRELMKDEELQIAMGSQLQLFN